MNPLRIWLGRKNFGHCSAMAMPRAVIVGWCALLSVFGEAMAGEAVRTQRGEMRLPTYAWWPAVKHPYFRGTDGLNIYPYPMLDFLSREQSERSYRTVVLENEYLRITILPELGGKVHEVIDKVTGEPMFYVNPVIKPGLIGQCGAWVSGGIEWNTGPQGHTVGCMQPVSVEILPAAADGSQSVAIGERERIYGTRWTVVLTLRPGRSFIEERIRIYNATETIRPYYFWNCTAVPNTPGFQFIYPMTLGTDHGGTEFYAWPVHEGKDLSWGTNYQDAASIFAYECDQDFFGSYNHDLGRGIVAYADHRQLPGKKAWTWGWGSYGRMHQMDLTDDEGFYNEVQTGPLLTQADVGRLDPHEVVAWEEWWYPIRGLGGFTFANRDLAVNAGFENGRLRLRLASTGGWEGARVTARQAGRVVAEERVSLVPERAVELLMDGVDGETPARVEVEAADVSLAVFDVPLALPHRERPEPRVNPEAASGFARRGWDHYLFARFTEAAAQFAKALELDAESAEARAGMAFLDLGRDDGQAAEHAGAALRTQPDHGLARYALAVALLRQGDEQGALDEAWQAALDPKIAVAARALAGRILIRQGAYAAAVRALSAPGPWQGDVESVNLLAIAYLAQGRVEESVERARSNMKVDPLDGFARSILWRAGAEENGVSLESLLKDDSNRLLDLAVDYVRAGQERIALTLLQEFHLQRIPEREMEPMLVYWAAWLGARVGEPNHWLRVAQSLPSDGVFPHRLESEAVLRWALESEPADGRAALYLGHLLFAWGRHAEGRSLWERAGGSGIERGVAWRALGMASRTLDRDTADAMSWLGKAQAADPSDAIVARDLARVLFELADREASAERRLKLRARAQETLRMAFEQGKGRSDFVVLLARAQNQLGQFAETARLLDSVRITIWEGAREAHDLFEEAHVALGKTHLEAGRAEDALREFDRALEYPENLATGRLEKTREAMVQYPRGVALSALGRKAEAEQAWRKAADEPGAGNARHEEARRLAREALQTAGHSRVGRGVD